MKEGHNLPGGGRQAGRGEMEDLEWERIRAALAVMGLVGGARARLPSPLPLASGPQR